MLHTMDSMAGVAIIRAFRTKGILAFLTLVEVGVWSLAVVTFGCRHGTMEWSWYKGFIVCTRNASQLDHRICCTLPRCIWGIVGGIRCVSSHRHGMLLHPEHTLGCRTCSIRHLDCRIPFLRKPSPIRMACKNCGEEDSTERRAEDGTVGCDGCTGQCHTCGKCVLNENGRYMDDDTWVCVPCIKKKFNL